MCMIKTKYRGWVQLGDGKVCSNSNALEGNFQSVDTSVVQEMMSARADRFIRALDTDQYGQSFRGKEFAEPVFGAFGEKL